MLHLSAARAPPLQEFSAGAEEGLAPVAPARPGSLPRPSTKAAGPSQTLTRALEAAQGSPRLLLVPLHFPVGHGQSWPRQQPEGQHQALGIQGSEVRARRGLGSTFCLCSCRAIFTSLWFEQEAIIKVFLGKVACAEREDSPSHGKITGSLP